MGKQIQLHIPEPCHENWNNMSPAEKGRFCGSCQKHVVDFTNMNDQQLVAFFRRQTNGSVCGRFMQDQLDRTFEIPKKLIPCVMYFFEFALPEFLVSSKVTAQVKVAIVKRDTVITPTPPRNMLDIPMVTSDRKNEKLITGKVIDDNNHGVPYASILLKGTTSTVGTDSTGFFSIVYDGHEDSCVLVSSCAGFEQGETFIDLKREEDSVIIPMISTNTFNGKVIVGVVLTEIDGPSIVVINDVDTAVIADVKQENIFDNDVDTIVIADIEPKSIFDTVWSKIFYSRPRVYPNPIMTNTALTIEMKRHDMGAYLFQLVTLNGQVMLRKEFWVDEQNNRVKINFPSIPAGAYVLQMTNKKSGKTTSEKIIVE